MPHLRTDISPFLPRSYIVPTTGSVGWLHHPQSANPTKAGPVVHYICGHHHRPSPKWIERRRRGRLCNAPVSLPPKCQKYLHPFVYFAKHPDFGRPTKKEMKRLDKCRPSLLLVIPNAREAPQSTPSPSQSPLSQAAVTPCVRTTLDTQQSDRRPT